MPARPDGGAPNPRLVTVSAGARPLAQLGLVPAGAYDTGPLESALDARDLARANAFRRKRRREEFVVSRWLLTRLQVHGPTSLSHCDHWIAAAATPWKAIGVDVESRLPRQREAVAERLGWQDLAPERHLQAWTLWEAWRKLENGSVLDSPDLPYALVLREAEGLFGAPRNVAGAWWFSLALDGAVLSGVVRD